MKVAKEMGRKQILPKVGIHKINMKKKIIDWINRRLPIIF